MQLSNSKQDEHDIIRDKVFAAMETGNAGQARTILREYANEFQDKAQDLRTEVISGYGVAL